MSFAKVQAIMGLIWGLVAGLFYFFAILGFSVMIASMPVIGGGGLVGGIILGLITLVFCIIGGAIGGFICGALMALVYNFAAGKVGGVELGLK
jgi:hypothetical protein